ncbi:glycosyl hydrolases family 18-domain-containing protein [Penicillium longicatenatum]|uniref:glycosyl hydrolases family 18-domain-containing protein n=1 Tax=Penicillium longicatenatum TaxID=1561947 RepID=UPI0025483600|nr:glycosyl hydrolases family 18-domain-containing protein [Penicillium longicatenatum]KAJ5636936.1 glycosyl hydrolases family 18-domain-containing protein [Penicillium longicatenatum]
MLDPLDVSSKIKLDTEHPKSIISALFRTTVGGILPSSTKIVLKVINGAKWEKHWATSVSAFKSLPSIADGNSLIPNDRLYSVLGSVNYRDVFLKAEKELNMIKGRIFYMKPDRNGLLQNTFTAPQAEKAFNGFLQAAIKTGSGENAFFDPIRRTIGVFSYIHHEEVLSRINTVRQNLYLECQILAEYVDGFQNLPAIYKEFDTDYYNIVTELSRT